MPRKTAGSDNDARATSGATSDNGPGQSRVKPSERIDQHIAGIPDWRAKVLATIRKTMLESDPAVTEDWKWMGSPVWYCAGMIAVANPHKGKVKLTFSQGAKLTDPDHLFNAGMEGSAWRAIDIFEKDRLDSGALRRLVRSAIAYNRSKLKDNAARASPKKRSRPSERALKSP